MSSPSPFDFRSCSQAFARLDDWIDRELSAEELELVRRHLEICATCASEFRVEGDLLRSVRQKLRRIELPPGLEARIWRHVMSQARADRTATGPSLPPGNAHPHGKSTSD
jgi:anti-sigma factor (TIGR02949 family)